MRGLCLNKSLKYMFIKIISYSLKLGILFIHSNTIFSDLLRLTSLMMNKHQELQHDWSSYFMPQATTID